MARPTYLDAVAVFGGADGALTVDGEGPTGTTPLLSRAGLSGGIWRWNRHEIARSPLVSSVVVTWEPAKVDALLREVELWGRPASAPPQSAEAPLDSLYTGVPAGAYESQAPQGEQTIALSTVGGPGVGGTFTVAVDADPVSFERAFLVYELAGLPHFTSAVRTINGQRALGHFGISRGAKGGLQVEEIAPGWLQRGTNRIQFLPAETADPGSYRVSALRVVGIPKGATPLDDVGARAWEPLRDGREATGWHVAAGRPADTRSWSFGTSTQPWALDFRLPNRSSGTLTVTATQSHGQTSARGKVTVHLEELSAGWHRIPLDRLPPAESLALSLTGAAETAADVSEMQIEGSALPADEAPRMSVTYPLSGECVNHRVHVRGFVIPSAVESFEVNGAIANDAISSDGAFAVEMSEKQLMGRAVTVEARYPGGGRVRHQVRIGACIDRPLSVLADNGRPRQPVEDLGAPYGVTVRAGEAATLSFAGARLEIPAGAVDKDVRLTVRPMPAKEIGPLDSGMTNLSPEGEGFRFGPHGMVFKKPIQVVLPYDKSRLPAGFTANDVRTFYYDEALKRWEQVGLLAQNDAEMVAVSDHFTDFINATIPMPEHPGTQSENPTSLKDIKLADPAAGISLIEPPTANSNGTANLRLPIEVPPGRNGIQPSLALSYDSSRGNGWVGVGWDLPISSIQLDTRFGVPNYDGTETYLLDGEMLAQAPSPPPEAPTSANTTYYQRRSEGRFDWIARVGSSSQNFTWTVTNKDGVQFFYGSSDASRLIFAPTEAHGIARWYLDRVVDRFGNQMTVSYATDSGPGPTGNTEPFTQVYPTQIDYTSNGGLSAPYHILFTRGGPTGSTCDRPDVVIDGRLRFQVLTRCLLKKVDVEFQSQIIRSYVLNYNSPALQFNPVAGVTFEPGHFGKSLLESVEVRGTGGTDSFVTHSFDYFATNEILGNDGEPGSLNLLGDPMVWAPLLDIHGAPDTSDGLNHSQDSSTSNGGSIGASIDGYGLNFGVNDTSATGSTFWMPTDFAGNGLLNFVSSDGLLNLGALTSEKVNDPSLESGVFTPMTTPSMHSGVIEQTSRSVWSLSGSDNDLPGLITPLTLGAGGDLSNEAEKTQGLADMNGDGFPDQIFVNGSNLSVVLNNGSDALSSVTNWNNYNQSGQTCNNGKQAIQSKNTNPFADALTRFVAPYTGTVMVGGSVGPLIPDTGGATQATIYQNNTVVWQHGFSDNSIPCVPAPGNSCGGGLTLSVQGGDRIYMRLGAVNTPGQAVSWDPKFTYTTVGSTAVDPSQANLLEAEGASIYQFDQAADFRIVGRSLMLWSADSSGTVSVSGTLQKQTTSDNLQVVISKGHGVVPPTPLMTLTQGIEAGSTAPVPITLNNISVQAGDSLFLGILSDVPTDPARVQWNPTIVYQNYCRLPPGGTTSVCGNVDCTTLANGLPSCTMEGDPNPLIPVPTRALFQQGPVFRPSFQFDPGIPTHSFVTASAGPVTITGAVLKTAQTSGNIYATIQGVNQLYAKTVFHGVDIAGTPMLVTTPNLPAGTQLFFNVYSDTPDGPGAISWDPMIGAAHQSINFKVRSEGRTPDPTGSGVTDQMAGGYHGWSFSEWNQLVSFDEGQIDNATPTQPSVFPMFQVKGAFVPLVNPDAVQAVGNIEHYGGEAQGRLFDEHGGALDLFASAAAPGVRLLGQFGRDIFDSTSCSSGGPFEQTSSSNLSVTAGTTIGVATAAATVNVGSSQTNVELIDMNGDRYPDVVTNGQVLFNNGKTGFDNLPQPVAVPQGVVRNINHFNVGLSSSLSVSGPPPTNNLEDVTDSGGQVSGFAGANLGLTYGMSTTTNDLIDMNGDGLPDQVQSDPTTGNVNVQLNLGRSFSQPIVWGSSLWKTQTVTSVQTLVDNVGLANVNTEYLKVTDITEANGGAGIGFGATSGGDLPIGVGFGVDSGTSYTVLRSLVDLVDINGDGLPDQVMRKPGDAFISVKLNLGDHFDDEKVIFVSDWGTAGATISIPAGIMDAAGVPDALGFSIGQGSVTSSSYSVGVWIFSATYTRTDATEDTRTSLAFEDIDGDGMLDHVLKVPGGNGKVYVRLNQTGKTNLLRHVSRPLGGSFDLDYQRVGNYVNSSNGNGTFNSAPDMPGNQWALAEVDVNDGRENTYTDTFSYDVPGKPGVPSGFYDRTERENEGFSHVTTVRGTPNGTFGFSNGDGSRIERFYANTDFYRKGLLLGEFEEDQSGNIIRGTSVQYLNPQSASSPPANRTGIFFPAESDRYSMFFERSTADVVHQLDPSTMTAPKFRHEHRVFDLTRGNLKEFDDYGDEATTADDLSYTIGYLTEANTHVTRANLITATGIASGKVLRQRSATFDSGLGSIHTLTNVVTGGRNPANEATYNQANAVYTYTHDAFGNLHTYLDPGGHSLQYTYDTTTQIYRTRVDDLSFGYFSTAGYDFGFGLMTNSTDVDGQQVKYVYDEFGRLFQVFGPDDQTSTVPTIGMTYDIVDTNPLATTSHKDVQHSGDPIQTVTFIDGLDRVIQTKKDLDDDSVGNGTISTGMSVSGQVIFDSMGRVAAQGQPIFDNTDAAGTFVMVAMKNPTTYQYDQLGRVTTVTAPDTPVNGASQTIVTTTAYAIEHAGDSDNLGDGRTWLLTDVRDGNANVSPAPPANTGRRLSYADSRGNRVAVREFNQLGFSTTLTSLTTTYGYDPLDELTSVTDAAENVTTATYDTVGQMILLNSPDAGQTEFQYDLAGNLGRKQTPVLRAANQFITYAYTADRLNNITYPTSPTVTYTYGASTETGDAHGNVASRIKQVTFDNGSETRTYDHLGNVNQTQTTLNRMSTTTGLPASMTFTMQYTYDCLGRMQTMTFPNWIDQSFNILSGAGELVTYTYDHGGNLDKITGFDQTPNPQQTSTPRNYTYLNHIGYNEFEQRTVLTSGNAIANQYGYDAQTRRLTNIKASANGSFEQQQHLGAVPFHNLQYTYDKVGNVTQMNNNVSVQPGLNAGVFVGPLTTAYAYDNLYQLQSMSSKYRGNVAYGYQYANTFTYDAIGNMATKAQSEDRLVWDNQTVNTNDTNPAVNQLAGSRFDHNVNALTFALSYQYTSGRPHAAAPVTETLPNQTPASRTYSYDANGNNKGNTFQGNNRTQTWNEENRLNEVDLNGGMLAKFRYNDVGERTKKQTSGGDAWYVNQYFCLLPGNLPTKHIFAGTERVATKTDAIYMQTPVLDYYHNDHLGTTSYLTVATQDLVQHERYFAFGGLWRPGDEQDETDLPRGTLERNWLFTGKEWDTDESLYYFGARYFDPHSDVWQSTDPILDEIIRRGAPPAGLGLYTYALNNPVIVGDPTGLDPENDRITVTGQGMNQVTRIDFDIGDPKIVGPIRKDLTGFSLNTRFDDTSGAYKVLVVGAAGGGVAIAAGPAAVAAAEAFAVGHPALVAAGTAVAAGEGGIVMGGGGVAAKGAGLANKAKSLGAAAARTLPPNARTTTNAAEVFRRLERFHGIDVSTASERLHDIKEATGHGGADNVIFDLTGNMYDRLGNWIGSLTEGGAKGAK